MIRDIGHLPYTPPPGGLQNVSRQHQPEDHTLPSFAPSESAAGPNRLAKITAVGILSMLGEWCSELGCQRRDTLRSEK